MQIHNMKHLIFFFFGRALHAYAMRHQDETCFSDRYFAAVLAPLLVNVPVNVPIKNSTHERTLCMYNKLIKILF